MQKAIPPREPHIKVINGQNCQTLSENTQLSRVMKLARKAIATNMICTILNNCRLVIGIENIYYSKKR